MPFEIQAHRGNDIVTLRRLLAASPSSVEIDVGLSDGEVVIAHDVDHGDASGLGLERALALAGATPVVVEAKCFPPSTPSPAAFARALGPYLGLIELCSFDDRVLEQARGLHPGLRTTHLFAQPVRITAATPAIGPRHDLVTADLVESAHALGLRVVPWTVNRVREMVSLIDLGVDGLVTDEPALLHEIVRSRLAAAA